MVTRSCPRSRDPVNDLIVAPAESRSREDDSARDPRETISSLSLSHLPKLLLPWFRPRTEQGDTSFSLAALLTAHAAPFHLPHLGPGHLCMSTSRTRNCCIVLCTRNWESALGRSLDTGGSVSLASPDTRRLRRSPPCLRATNISGIH